MQAHNLVKPAGQKEKRRIGRGGKRGSFSGRGIKGQKSRAGRRIRPQIRDVVKKIHKRRGYGKNRGKSFGYLPQKPTVVSKRSIEDAFEDGAHITPQELVERKLVRRTKGRKLVVKVLGNTKSSKRFTFDEQILMSGSLRAKLHI
ncbi:MAG TPA: uL15 family ribosomal protein [Candidatus Paceibacterota bacterium]